ncbi:MAG: AEC family transporter [Hyphomicrobium sp.]
MIVVLTIVAPVFGLIIIGYLAAKYRLLDESAGRGLTEFAFKLGIPALLCRTVATAKLSDLSLLHVWGAFYGAAALTWITATLLTRVVLARPAIDGPAIAMSSVFGNTAMLGLPLSIATFGAEAAAPIALILSIHAPLLWMTGLVHSTAVNEQRDQSVVEMLTGVARDLSRNAIIIGILIGALWRLVGIELPKPVDRILELLAQAGVPASLVALGLTLVAFEIKGQTASLTAIIALKLLFMPLVAWSIAHLGFGLSGVPLGVIVIMAAMPAGANAFLFATKEGRAINSASGAVALGSILAAATTAVLISLLTGR